ncbi:MAG: MBL fold metallo-hydrolase [bacterium]
MTLPLQLRVFEPQPGILAFYDGRVPQRFMAEDNWVDADLQLGTVSYAVVSGAEALIYDTHVSLAHGHAIKAELEARGVHHFRVVLSHWHLDHVAGTGAFPTAEVIANHKTLAHLRAHQADIESGDDHGPPAINPLILPDTPFDGQLRLRVGDRHVTLIEANIHSDDETVLWLPDERILLAADTVEDCVTYVAAPQDLAVHLEELDRLIALAPRVVLPAHGEPGVISKGGYGPDLLPATQRYIRWLLRLRDEPALVGTPLRTAIADDLAAGVLHYFAAYEPVHAQNIARCRAVWQRDHNLLG